MAEVPKTTPPLVGPDAPGAGYITQGWPAPGLRKTVRHITGPNADGKTVFLSTDCGDHHRVMGENQAIANILYSTKETPVDIAQDADLSFAKENEPPLHYRNGTVVRMVDFGPGVITPLHRALSIDYGIVLEGEFEFTLDSGETRVMRQGDISINRVGAHSWRNITGNGTMPGRMLYILLGSEDVVVNGQKLDGYLGLLGKYYKGEGED